MEPMTETSKRPLLTATGIITAAIALALPFLADRLILSAMVDAKDVGIGSVIGMAVYTALPFLLLDSAMRPRRRVRLALWLGLALTVLVWGAYAYTGAVSQNYIFVENEINEICKTVDTKPINRVKPSTDLDKPIGQTCLRYKRHINYNLGLYMLAFAWPAIVSVLIGLFAKLGEKDHVA